MGGLKQCYVYHNDLEVYKLSFLESLALQNLLLRKNCADVMGYGKFTQLQLFIQLMVSLLGPIGHFIWVCGMCFTGQEKPRVARTCGNIINSSAILIKWFKPLFPEKILLKWEISIIFSLIFPDFHSFEDLELFWNWNLNNLCQLSEFPH